MKRILLKLSGEALAGEKHHGFDEPTVTVVAKQVKKLVDDGVQVGIVIGGGNFWRGRTSETIDRNKDKSRPDWYACHSYELYLCIGNFPLSRNENSCIDSV